MSSAVVRVSLTPAVFHLPEPVNAVSRSYGQQPIVPRGPRLKPLMDDLRDGIRRALGAEGYEPVLMTGSGSTAVAAVLGSCLTPTERLLVVRNGAYGDRIASFAKQLGQPLVDLASPYGERPDLGRIEQLCSSGQVDAVAMIYGCTSSCNLNPIAEVAAIARRYQVKLLLDGISALFIEPMDLEGLGVAAVMGSCNKGLHSHPNLTFALVRRDLMDQMEHIAPRVPSLELYQTWLKQRGGGHPYTIDPMSLCQARAALGYLEAIGGVAARYRLYQRRCELLRAGYERLGLTIARWEGMPLQSIGTALHIPERTSYDELADRLASDPVDGHVFEIYAAQGKLSGKLFRVFHMGEYSLEAYEIFLRALAMALP
ncbi:MAG: 2-aminoethylphosphonate--pyruvate aminotransferase [Deltaproteobacteria bacterium]|nr:MAG: 2-aminoethylphosphonate--pyruvate aminotransferase [Deltaproteobacteria bacterium]